MSVSSALTSGNRNNSVTSQGLSINGRPAQAVPIVSAIFSFHSRSRDSDANGAGRPITKTGPTRTLSTITAPLLRHYSACRLAGSPTRSRYSKSVTRVRAGDPVWLKFHVAACLYRSAHANSTGSIVVMTLRQAYNYDTPAADGSEGLPPLAPRRLPIADPRSHTGHAGRRAHCPRQRRSRQR